ncbi:MAG: hypothetical protein GY737_30060, partial [Desulfobacteraceae bacterium]|nr:hypothetical protein [Desulfobacteraceae bacterium]
FLINDIDTDLIKFYKDLQKDFEGTLNKIKKEFEEITKDMKEDKELTQYLRNNKGEINPMIYLISSSVGNCCQINKFYTKFNNFMNKKTEYKELFKRIRFYNMDAQEFIKKHQAKKNILFYFDPPYFNSNNINYNHCLNKTNSYHDGTSIYIDILEHFKKQSNNSYSIFVLNKIDIINYVFKDYFYQEYKGVYQNTGKNIKHHIIYTKNIDF